MSRDGRTLLMKFGCACKRAFAPYFICFWVTVIILAVLLKMENENLFFGCLLGFIILNILIVGGYFIKGWREVPTMKRWQQSLCGWVSLMIAVIGVLYIFGGSGVDQWFAEKGWSLKKLGEMESKLLNLD